MTEILSLSDAVAFLTERARKSGADAAESCGVRSLSASAECRARKTENMEYAETSGVDLRVFCGKRPAVVSSCVLDRDTLAELAERAVQMAKTVPEDPYCGLADPAVQAGNTPDLDLFDPAEKSTTELLELALKTEDAALSVKGVAQSDGASAGFEKSHIVSVSTTGLSREYDRSSAFVSVSVIAADADGNKETDYDYSSAVYFSDLEDAAKIGRGAGERAVKRLRPTKIDSGVMDVVFEPRLARGLVGTFAGAVNGAGIARGTSFLKDEMGRQVLPETLSILENPLKKRGAASRPCDAEGLPCAPCALADKGVLSAWLLDLRSARKLGLEPNGHAARGLGANPHPSASNLFLTGGTLSPAELIGDIKRGLYLTQLFGQGVDMITGDYSRGASGFLIENGEITIPVSEITVAGNLKSMFRNMAAANDLDDRHAINAPTIRLAGLTVAGK